MSNRKKNREMQLVCICIMLASAVVAIVLMNQADRFGKATHTGYASIAFALAGASLFGWFLFSLSDWTND